MDEQKLDEVKKHLKTALNILEHLDEPELATYNQMGFLKGQLAKGVITEIPKNITKKEAWELIRKIKSGEKVE